jgi:hypothetical protein
LSWVNAKTEFVLRQFQHGLRGSTNCPTKKALPGDIVSRITKNHMDKRIIQDYRGKRSLLLGEVNSGKTAKTDGVLRAFIKAGYTDDIAVLDLSPDPVGGVGGKMSTPADAAVLYLTAAIAAPRMMGRDAAHTQRLAETNARVIEDLFEELCAKRKPVLFVNDATLYFHAGSLETFLQVLDTASTQIVNAYRGTKFEDSALTRRERRLTQALIETCDMVEYL